MIRFWLENENKTRTLYHIKAKHLEKFAKAYGGYLTSFLKKRRNFFV